MKNTPKPIYIVGIPRTGTTWIASILNTASGIKYFHEPFNCEFLPSEYTPYMTAFLRAEDEAPEFSRYCRDAFAGKSQGRFVRAFLAQPYRKLSWWPGRVLIKDVHAFLALEWIDCHISPNIVIVIRHPCAVAESWFRLGWKTDKFLGYIMSQPKLIEVYLKPFEYILRNVQDFWQGIGALWGASYYVMLKQQQMHPEWLVVQHEALCQDPIGQYQKLFAQLNINWTTNSETQLMISTHKNSLKPFAPNRISAQEPDKWKERLEVWQIERIRQFVEPFDLTEYAKF